MIEAMLVVENIHLTTVMDAIDIYEGSIPPAAKFQVVDVDNTTTEEFDEPTQG